MLSSVSKVWHWLPWPVLVEVQAPFGNGSQAIFWQDSVAGFGVFAKWRNGWQRVGQRAIDSAAALAGLSS